MNDGYTLLKRRNILKPITALLLTSCLATAPSYANNELPEIGTAGTQALTIAQEKNYGNIFMHIMRANSPVIYDPLLANYINQLGQRLVSHAENVHFPFHFILIRDSTINAAAFLGGYVKVNSGVILYADTEGQLASVMAHEISHVTQRHIARSIENAASTKNLTIAGLMGSVILAIANPAAGMAAMQSSVAASIQHQINFTRRNEYEADHIGMQVLYRSGFDPQSMVKFFGRLATKYRYASKPPAWLSNHPMTADRVADAQSRASQYPSRKVAPSLQFQMAKARIHVRFSQTSGDQAYSFYKHQLTNHNYRLKAAAQYGLALALFKQTHFVQAEKIMDKLHQSYPQNMFVLDLQSDIDIAQKQPQKAINRLKKAAERYPDNQIVTINLASAYMAAEQYASASQVLDHYLRDHPNDSLGWKLATQAYRKQQLTVPMHQARAEYFALYAQYDQAIRELKLAKLDSVKNLNRARIGARIQQFKARLQQLKDLKNL